MDKEILINLGAPFPFDEVEAKLQVTSQDKKTGMVVFYLDSRTIQKRLDDVIGHFNWKNQYTAWHDFAVNDAKGITKTQKSQLCGIAIYHEGRNEWVGKFDGAECSDIEPIKGGLTDSFKRAACMWGIGRYLYEMKGIWIEIKPQGNSYAIKDDQWPKLRTAYDAAVKKIFGASASQQKQVSGNNAQGSHGAQPQQVNSQQNQQPPTAPPVQQNTGSGRTAAVPPPQGSANNNQPAVQPQVPDNTQNPQAGPLSEHDYKIKSIKPAGGESQLMELLNGAGKVTTAYIKTNGQGMKVGTLLRNVKLEQKEAQFGKYTLVTNYELAA